LKFEIPYTFPVSGNYKESIVLDKEIIKEDVFVNEMEEVLAILRDDYPSFIFFDKINLGSQEVLLQNDNNLDLYYKNNYVVIDLKLKDRKKSNIYDAFVGYSGRRYDRKEFLQYTDGMLSVYNNMVDLPTSKTYPCIFTTAGQMPVDKLITELNGLRIGTKSSLFTDKMGKKIFNENFTFSQSSDPYELMIPFFDAEGVVNKNFRYPLIEKGVISAPYTDKKTAALFGFKNTGSAIAEYDGVPTLGLAGFEVKATEKTLKELLGGQPAIFIASSFGGDFTPEGNYAAPVQVGMLFDGNRLVGRLPEFQISSTLYNMFGDAFIGVSNDKYLSLNEERSLVMEFNISKL
ncbi:MAG TPA: metallopeptidase TldD-related protein, partial [Bacillota bacterium]|nr:metallopeptidase TldD-related protein [Bacillota bacterium]